MTETNTAEKSFLTINETCARYGITRSTFYRMLSDPHLELESILVRIPPVTGRIRVPTRAFDEWIHRRRAPSRPAVSP